MSSDPNWPSRYSHPTRAAKRANLAEKVAWALKDAQAEIDSLTVLLGQAQKDRDEFARAEDRERTRAECALVARDAAEARAAEAQKVLREIAVGLREEDHASGVNYGLTCAARLAGIARAALAYGRRAKEENHG